MPCADEAGHAQDARIPGMLKEMFSIKQFSHSINNYMYSQSGGGYRWIFIKPQSGEVNIHH